MEYAPMQTVWRALEKQIASFLAAQQPQLHVITWIAYVYVITSPHEKEITTPQVAMIC